MCVTVLAVWERMRQNSEARSPDMAESVLIVTDSVGRSGMDSSPWLSHPWKASTFTQDTMVQDRLRCSQVVSCSQETD